MCKNPPRLGGKSDCIDWTRPPGAIPSFDHIVAMGNHEYGENAGLLAADYLCALLPDSLVAKDFGSGSFRDLDSTDECLAQTGDHETLRAHAQIGYQGGLDTWVTTFSHDSTNVVKRTKIDGQDAATVVKAKQPDGFYTEDVFFALPGHPNNILHLEIQFEDPAAVGDPPNHTVPTTSANAKKVLTDVAHTYTKQIKTLHG